MNNALDQTWVIDLIDLNVGPFLRNPNNVDIKGFLPIYLIWKVRIGNNTSLRVIGYRKAQRVARGRPINNLITRS